MYKFVDGQKFFFRYCLWLCTCTLYLKYYQKQYRYSYWINESFFYAYIIYGIIIIIYHSTSWCDSTCIGKNKMTDNEYTDIQVFRSANI